MSKTWQLIYCLSTNEEWWTDNEYTADELARNGWTCLREELR